MQDRETDTYWAIMAGEAIAGEMKGTRLKELPVGEKMRWQDWVTLHPNTLVLSVNGREDGRDSYRDYFQSPRGFRGSSAKDDRLATKEPIFAFHFDGQSFAVPHKAFAGGKTFDLGKVELFLYRPATSDVFQSTTAYTGTDFVLKDKNWYEVDSGAKFNESRAAFESDDGERLERFQGFDTFWYNWSLSNPETKLLK